MLNKKVSAKEQYEAQQESAYFSTGLKDKYQLCVTEELDSMRIMKEMKNFVDKICLSNNRLFWMAQGNFHQNNVLKSSPLGRAFKQIIESNIPDIEKHFPLHRLYPTVDLCMKTIKEYRLDGVDYFDNPLVLDALNQCVVKIREESSTPEMKTRVANFIRSSNDNYKEFLKYITELRKKYGKLLVLRMDFSYKSSRMYGALEKVTYDEANEHRKALINFMREFFGENLAGYAWKLEYGLFKGYHYHMVIFLNGANLRADVTIAKLLGEYWVDHITNERGVYYNCNARKKSYRFCCIGMISHADEHAWEGFQKMAVYLTKSDYLFKLKVPKGRCFGKGGMPKMAAVALGRPRKGSGIDKPE
jgi:Inovirus Gp2